MGGTAYLVRMSWATMRRWSDAWNSTMPLQMSTPSDADSSACTVSSPPMGAGGEGSDLSMAGRVVVVAAPTERAATMVNGGEIFGFF